MSTETPDMEQSADAPSVSSACNGELCSSPEAEREAGTGHGVSGALVAPFPYFGGKRMVAAEVWKRLGDPPNFVEPFAGSLAVLLARPHPSKTETVNDVDGLLTNFWRAVAADPDAVAEAADWPVSECDLHARHYALVQRRPPITERMTADPGFYDVEAAAWWVWGCCCWIGSGWCSGEGPWASDGERLVNRNAGMGIHRKVPHLGDAGRADYILGTFRALAARLRGVRIACGDFERVLGPSVTHRHGTTGVLLDPPYPEGAMTYSAECHHASVHERAVAWAVANGGNEALRIALCGYNSFEMPHGWTAHRWKARGGYGSQGDGEGRANAAREVIWFSPHCLDEPQRDLFSSAPRHNGGARDAAA